MTEKGKRWKKRVHYRTPGGKTRQRYKEKKSSAVHCVRCGGILHGVPHGKRKSGVRKLSRSEKKPSVMFAGMLCGDCRRGVFEEASLLMESIKPLNEVGLKEKPMVLQALSRMTGKKR